ncbi:endocytosis defective- protein [Blastocladiella emersonii ATCC 22665]|nr:endocytosis defective- protein [Blastocladiella emersonii ATCC 22665]
MSNATTYSGISIAERDRYRDIFNSLGPIDSVVTGEQCRSVFLKSELDPAQLKKIWELADMDRDGALDIEEFIIAMRLIYDSMNGAAIPPVLPGYMIPPIKAAVNRLNPNADPLALAAGVPGIPNLSSMGMGMGPAPIPGMPGMMVPGMMMPGQFGVMMDPNQLAGQVLRGPTIEFTDNFDWYMPPAEKLKYEMEFERAPTTNDLLPKHHAYEVFVLSRRPHEEFDIIWQIVDLNGQDAVTLDQYVCMQHIINQRKANKPFPRALPPEVISKFRSVAGSVAPSSAASPSASLSRAVSTAAVSDSSSRYGSRQSLVAPPNADEAKVKALEEELEFLQRELAKLGDPNSAEAGAAATLVGDYQGRIKRMQDMIDWFNEHLPLLPTESSGVDLGVMMQGLQDEVALADAQHQREKSTTI